MSLRPASPISLARILLLLALSAPGLALAQFEEPDTLGWRGYLPLAVGNVWQYEVEGANGIFGVLTRAYLQWHVVADTLIDAHTYYLLEATCDSLYASNHPDAGPPCPSGRIERTFLRYDEATANLIERAAEPQGSDGERLWLRYGFRLDAAFGAYQPASDLDDWAGEYEYSRDSLTVISGDTVATTVKRILVYSVVPGSLAFAQGIGLVGMGFFEGGGTAHTLRYARVDGRVYGAPLPLAADRPGAAPAVAVLDAYPQPAHTQVEVRFETDRPERLRLVVYDLLGRAVAARDLGRRPAGAHHAVLDVAGLGSGTYVLVLDAPGRVAARRSLVVVR